MKPTRLLQLLIVFAVLTVNLVAQNNWWIGPYGGNWSDPTNWAAGLPGPTDGVQIFSGTDDYVFLDSNATIGGLFLGSGPNPSTSTLSDNGLTQSLTVGLLSVGETGVINFQGYGSSITADTVSNAGTILLNNASVFQVNGDFLNVISTPATFDISGGSTASISGNLLNNNTFTTGSYGAGGNTLNIGGTLTNNGFLTLAGPGDVANVGTLVNIGSLSVMIGTTLNVANQLNVTDIGYSSYYFLQGTFNAGPNDPFAQLTSIEGALALLNGRTTNITPIGGTLTNSGLLSIGDLLTTLNYGTVSTVNITGGLDNQGYLNIEPFSTLNLTTQLNVTDIPGLASYVVLGTFNAGPNDPFANLTSVEGQLVLGDGQTRNIVPNGNLLTVTHVPWQLGYFEVAFASTVNVNGDLLNNNGDVEVSGESAGWGSGHTTLTVTEAVTNSGTLSVWGDATANFGSLVNTGTVWVSSGAVLNLTNQPGGITDVLAGSTYYIEGDFTDVVNGTSAFAQLTNIYGTVTIVNGQTIQDNPIGGTLTIANGASLTVLRGSQLLVHSNIVGQYGANIYLDPAALIADGTFYNQGANITIDGNSVFSVGSISNGGPLMLTHDASVTVSNGFYQLASGTLGESIDATGFSILVVNGGPVVLDGTLDVLLDPNFDPAVGSFYKFLLFGPGSLSGTFASLQNAIFNNGTEKWVVIYSDAGGYVELMAQSNNQPTPEPASFLLLGTGLIGLSYGLRKRGPR